MGIGAALGTEFMFDPPDDPEEYRTRRLPWRSRTVHVAVPVSEVHISVQNTCDDADVSTRSAFF